MQTGTCFSFNLVRLTNAMFFPSTTSTSAIPASYKVRALRPEGVGVARQVLHFIANYFYPCRCLALSIQLCRQSLRVRSTHADIPEMRHQNFLSMREEEQNSEKWKNWRRHYWWSLTWMGGGGAQNHFYCHHYPIPICANPWIWII